MLYIVSKVKIKIPHCRRKRQNWYP